MQDTSYTRSESWRFLEETEIPRVYRAGDLIYQQGEEAARFYYLLHGEVRIFMSSADGAEQTLTLKKSGTIFGEAAFFDGKPRVSSARAVQKTAVISIDRPLLLKTFSRHPEFALELLQYLARNTRMLSHQINRMAFRQADERLAELLLELADEDGQISLSQEELGQMCGVTRMTITRVLKEFADQGFVSRSYRKLQILDEKGLKNLCPMA